MVSIYKIYNIKTGFGLLFCIVSFVPGIVNIKFVNSLIKTMKEN